MAPHALQNQAPAEQCARVRGRKPGGAVHCVEGLFEALLFDQYGGERVQDRGSMRRELRGTGKGLDGLGAARRAHAGWRRASPRAATGRESWTSAWSSAAPALGQSCLAISSLARASSCSTDRSTTLQAGQ